MDLLKDKSLNGLSLGQEVLAAHDSLIHMLWFKLKIKSGPCRSFLKSIHIVVWSVMCSKERRANLLFANLFTQKLLLSYTQIFCYSVISGSPGLTLKNEQTSISVKGNNFGLRSTIENSRLKRDHMSI